MLELLTDRLRLRRMRVADAAGIRRLWLERDPRVPRHRRIDAAGHPTVVEIEELIEAQLAESQRTGLSKFAIERRDAPGLIGYCGLTLGGWTPGEPEIVFEFARAAHGSGYATEAANAVLEVARNDGHRRIWASVRAWNVASFRVLDKLGFTDSGQRETDPEHGDTVWMTLELGASGG